MRRPDIGLLRAQNSLQLHTNSLKLALLGAISAILKVKWGVVGPFHGFLIIISLITYKYPNFTAGFKPQGGPLGQPLWT